MKTLMLWLAVHAAICAGAVHALALHEETRPPQRIAIAVDASFSMREVWEDVPKVLETIEASHPGSQFLVVTQPGKIGGWNARPRLEGAQPFAPRQIATLAAMDVWAGADRVYLVTNAPDESIEVPDDWTVRRGEGWTQ